MEKINLGGGSLGDNPILTSVLERSLESINTAMLMDYAHPLGMIELRQEIAMMHSTSPNNILITSSAQQALSLVLSLIESSDVFSGKMISFKEPAYMGFLRLIKKKLIQKNPLASFEESLKLEDFGILYLTSNFHNSTGESLSDLQKILIAEKAVIDRGLVIEDNPFDLLYFNKRQPSTIFGLAPGNTIYIGSLSKVLAPGLRVGYILASDENVRRIQPEKEDFDWFTSTLSQQICVNSLKQNYLDSLREYFKAKRDFALSTLEKYFMKEGISWNIPEGGIFIRIEFNGVDSQELMQTAQERYNLCLEMDSHNYSNGKFRNSTRINFAQNPAEVTEEGIKRLHECFQYLRSGVEV